MPKLLIVLLSISILAGCQNLKLRGTAANLYREGLPGTAPWAVLPFGINVADSMTEDNGEPKDVTSQVERILMVQLPSKGVESPMLYPDSKVTTRSDALSQSQAHALTSSQDWAEQNEISFGITGNISEWTHDQEGHPRVALRLSVIDIRTGDVLWISEGSSDGKKDDSIHDIGRVLILDLIQSLPVNRRL